MNEWQPIETYDALKKKPAFAVFYVKELSDGRRHDLALPACVITTRHFGVRQITHWMPLHEPTTA